MVSGIEKGVGAFLRQLIRIYQVVLSPWIGQQCRFYPSCSAYANEAILAHGPWRGSYLSIRRLLRCNPWFEGGFDPVPNHPVPDTDVISGIVLKAPEHRGQPCCPPK